MKKTNFSIINNGVMQLLMQCHASYDAQTSIGDTANNALVSFCCLLEAEEEEEEDCDAL